MTSDAGPLQVGECPRDANEPAAQSPAGGAVSDRRHWWAGEVVCTAANVPVEAVQWLWKDHFAIGKISLVVGTANVGKSLLVAGDFASRVSVGAAWPGGTPCPTGDVAIVGRLEGMADTLVPCLVSHGADLRRVHFVDGLAQVDEEEGWRTSIPGVVPALDTAMRRHRGIKLAIIDPAADFLGRCSGVALADALTALQSLARRYGVALVLVADTREGSRAPLAATLPAALASAARSVWVLSRDEYNEQRRLFVPAKNNLSAECDGHAWRLVDGKVQWEANAVASGCRGGAGGRAKRQAAAFLADFLRDGPRMWVVIQHCAKLAGHSPRTLERARNSVAETFKRPEGDGRWLWRLIGDTQTGSPGDAADLLGGDPVGRRASGGAPLRFDIASQPGDSLGLADLEEDDDDLDDDDLDPDGEDEAGQT